MSITLYIRHREIYMLRQLKVIAYKHTIRPTSHKSAVTYNIIPVHAVLYCTEHALKHRYSTVGSECNCLQLQHGTLTIMSNNTWYLDYGAQRFILSPSCDIIITESPAVRTMTNGSLSPLCSFVTVLTAGDSSHSVPD